MPKSGRLLLIKTVLCAIPLHAMLALDIPPKTIAAMNKICRGFLWCAKAEANGGQCSVAWDSVCTPMWAGGLVIPNLRWLDVAMRSRWSWLQRSDPSRPWAEFTLTVPEASRQLYRAATRFTVGNGRSTLFWEDGWLEGQRLQDIAPSLYQRVRTKVRRTYTVHEALSTNTWAADVGPELTPASIWEYLRLWEMITRQQIQEDLPDSISWAWEKNGMHSTKSAYAAKFWGREVAPTASFTWKSRAPLQCRFFVWLALKDRCWTSDQLAKRGLDHQEAFPLCDQEEETINLLMLDCVFACEVWTEVCMALGKQEWTPSGNEKLQDWCLTKTGAGSDGKDIQAVLTLVL